MLELHTKVNTDRLYRQFMLTINFLFYSQKVLIMVLMFFSNSSRHMNSAIQMTVYCLA